MNWLINWSVFGVSCPEACFPLVHQLHFCVPLHLHVLLFGRFICSYCKAQHSHYPVNGSAYEVKIDSLDVMNFWPSPRTRTPPRSRLASPLQAAWDSVFISLVLLDSSLAHRSIGPPGKLPLLQMASLPPGLTNYSIYCVQIVKKRTLIWHSNLLDQIDMFSMATQEGLCF